MIIIVARYKEDVEWTKQFPNVIIFNKGISFVDYVSETYKSIRGYNFLKNVLIKERENKQINTARYNEVMMNNVGREGHTYYKYICDNYHNLEDYTIFLQANPFDHSPNIISNVKKYLNNKELSIDFEFLSEKIHYSSLDEQCSKYPECKNIHNTWERVFGVKDDNNECIFGAGAQFIVSKKKILENSKEFYENIVKILEYSINPLEGYDIERFHKYIFTSKSV